MRILLLAFVLFTPCEIGLAQSVNSVRPVTSAHDSVAVASDTVVLATQPDTLANSAKPEIRKNEFHASSTVVSKGAPTKQGGQNPWNNLLPVVVGGLLAIAGGIIGTIFKVKYAQRVKLQEEIALRKVVVFQAAYSKLKTLESLHGQGPEGSAFKEVMGYEGWFWENRLFFPGEYAQVWIELKQALRILWRRQKHGDRAGTTIPKLESEVDNLIAKAIDEIYKETKTKRLVAKKLKF